MSLIRFLLLNYLSVTLVAAWPFTTEKPFSIMLDPAGDAGNTGRIIDDTFERGITLQYAQALKKRLEERIPSARIVLTRFPGETLAPLQNASFANRLEVDLYISIHCYQSAKPAITLYHFLYNPITDIWAKPRSLHLYPYNQAHLINVNKTMLWAEQIKNTLRTAYSSICEIKGPYGIPFKPLIGIKAPACAFELSLRNKDDWQLYIEPLLHSITTLVHVTAS